MTSEPRYSESGADPELDAEACERWDGLLKERLGKLAEAGELIVAQTAEGAEYAYRPDELIVVHRPHHRSARANQPRRFVDELPGKVARLLEALRASGLEVQLDDRRDDQAHLGLSLLRFARPLDLDAIAAAVPGDTQVGLNYVYRPTNHRFWGLPVPPQPTEPLEPPKGRDGKGVRIGVIDSGCWAGHEWWAGGGYDVGDRHGGPLAGSIDEELPFGAGGDDFPEAGHGTAVVGMVLQRAPLAAIRVARTALDHLIDDWDLPGLLDQLDVDIVNLSLGTATRDGQPPAGLDSALRRLAARRPPEAPVLVVAAAGNDQHSTPEYPAADKRVIGVGSMEADKSPSPWSNHGGWVDAAALGSGVRTTFLEGRPANVDADFAGYVRWSGTSFSAPTVTAALAALMSQGASPLQARFELVGKPGLPQVPTLGTLVD
ncbi:MAG: S8/S53 family peptidase [Acidimicrobiia bacterium]|nr:S8/S53 family peptidase [Acidimicrobiia bacterium]